MDQIKFAQQLRDRTKKFTIDVIGFYHSLHKSDEIRIIAKQLLRAASSVGANYRAACRARSDAEFYAKLSIVVEEADETLFWLEILEDSNLVQANRLFRLKSEAIEILSVVAKSRSTMKKKQKTRSGQNSKIHKQ